MHSSIEEEKNITLKEKLHAWATEYNIAQRSLTALLHILNEEGHDELPHDARTLMNTPKETIIRECGTGHYFHYGLETALQQQLKYFTNINNIENIEININIDGLPLAKSSQSQLWPILGQMCNIGITEPFLIGAYHGYTKPANAQDLLKDFCEEYYTLHTKGFSYGNKNYFVTIRAVICDVPAKSFVTGTKGHNGRFGCGKCFCEGDYYDHRIVFLNENALLRTNSNFRKRENEKHHISVSPFEILSDIDMINNFPLDYMHLVCLGVTKKLIHLWIKGHHIPRLRAMDINALSRDIIMLHKCIPIEFARHTRGINEVDRWKATEFRLFLLYLGPIVLEKYLHKDYLKHFYVFHTAIRILCHPEDCLYNNIYANELLTYFVKIFKVLYGETNLVFNVHNLIHICQDVKMYGPLDTFSAFPFENYLKTLKRMLRKSEKPLSQLNNRFHEYTTRYTTNMKNCNIDEPLFLKPDGKNLPLKCTYSHKQIKFKYFMLTAKSPDNCCYLKDGSVFRIKYIGYKDKVRVVLGNKYIDLQPILTCPCNSQNMNIHMSNGQIQDLQIVPITQIATKGFEIFYNEMYYVMPLLHF
ncbi:hypothetical protein ALC62_06406 [Cyphomyrmex costatus]|uniref:Transposase domain-containing protein n=1 Tax=Cyphomyrmex costatus TaxID=456900 RepID=A0A151IIX9_9HYME|nr:hypothetical protein ALC62_06406 [Cyphomyrmex costatus]